MKPILLATIAMLLVGCAAPFSTPNINPKFQSTELGADAGVFIFSITNNKAKQWDGYNAVPPNIFFSNEDGTRNLNIRGNAGTFFEKHILSQVNWTMGRVAAIRVVPGQYHFTGFATDYRAFQNTAFASEVAGLTFNIKPNEIVYIGNIDIYILPSGEQYNITLTDQFERDSEHIKEKWPNIKTTDITRRLAVLSKRPQFQNQPPK